MTVLPVVLDCDTGTDDAVAIMLAALHPGLDLLGVTTVFGNLAVADTTDNTRRVLDEVGRSGVPVHRGASSALPPGRRVPKASLAVDWLVETLRATTRPVTLVPTGPLTNVALALAADPRIVDAVDQLVMMGGSHAIPNVTPHAERNVWNDPVAADSVLRAGFRRLVMVTLDATHQAPLDHDDCDRLRRLGTPAGVATADLVEERIEQYAGWGPPGARPAAPVHDPVTVAYLVEPDVVTLRHLHVAVETTEGPTCGRTVIDVDGVTSRPPNAHVALTADRDRFVGVLLSTLG